MPRAAGIPFGHFVLTKRLARGGMAEVFLAHQRGPEGFNRRVAVKRVLPHLVESEEFVRMFHDEARLAARLSHPNIAHIYEFGRVDEHYFIAMEYLEGVHAGSLIKRGDTELMPAPLVARIGADACAGLHYAHQQRDESGRELRIVHRDVSPPNLMITYDGVVKLVDFGIAKAVSQVEQTRPGVVKGKYAYMSPEQTTNQPLDGKSDVFSLGLVLWELLAGRVAFKRNDPVEVMRAIRDGKVPALETVRPEVPAGLAAAIACSLERAPNDRPSASELGLMLEGFIKSSTELGTSLQLADWIQRRFPRTRATGEVPALASGRGTQATTPQTHATQATQMGTQATQMGTQATQMGTQAGPGQPAEHGYTITDVDALGDDDLTAIVNTPIPETRAAPYQRLPGATRGRRNRIILAAALTALVGGVTFAVLATQGGATGPAQADATPVPTAVIEVDAEAPAPPDAPPPPDAAPELAVLEVLTDPAGALVSVGEDQPAMTSPAAFADLPAGPLALRIELDGYETIERTVQLAPGQERTLDYTLTLIPPPITSPPPVVRKPKKPRPRGKGRLTARTQPYSVVYLGRRKLGTTPFANVPLAAGTYTLTFKNPKHKTYRKRIKIRAGKRTKLDFKLP